MQLYIQEVVSKLNRKVILMALLCTLSALILLIIVLQNKKGNAVAIEITNITDSSFTISWYTEKETKSDIFLKASSEASIDFPVLDRIGKKHFYDDLDIEQNKNGEYVLKKEGNRKRNTHHVTIRGIKSDTKYDIFQSSGLNLIKKDKSGNRLPQVLTAKSLEDIKTPDPIYGKVQLGDTDKKVEGMVYMYLSTLNNETVSQSISARIYNNTYSLDANSIRNGDFSQRYILQPGKTIFNVAVVTDNGYKIEKKIQTSTYKPLDTIVIQEATKVSISNSLYKMNLVQAIVDAPDEPGTPPIVKKSDGTACTLNSECTSGACTKCPSSDARYCGSGSFIQYICNSTPNPPVTPAKKSNGSLCNNGGECSSSVCSACPNPYQISQYCVNSSSDLQTYCPKPPEYVEQCGDAICSKNENAGNCPHDCEAKPAVCGNGVCETDTGESADKCSIDCLSVGEAELKDEEDAKNETVIKISDDKEEGSVSDIEIIRQTQPEFGKTWGYICRLNASGVYVSDKYPYGDSSCQCFYDGNMYSNAEKYNCIDDVIPYIDGSWWNELPGYDNGAKIPQIIGSKYDTYCCNNDNECKNFFNNENAWCSGLGTATGASDSNTVACKSTRICRGDYDINTAKYTYSLVTFPVSSESDDTATIELSRAPVDNFDAKADISLGYNPYGVELRHFGIDISGTYDNVKDREIYSPIDMEIVYTRNENDKNCTDMASCEKLYSSDVMYAAYGNVVVGKTVDSNGQPIYLIFSHCEKDTIAVKTGQKVSTDQTLCNMGNTGHSDEVHLHFEITRCDYTSEETYGLPECYINPLEMLNQNGASLPKPRNIENKLVARSAAASSSTDINLGSGSYKITVNGKTSLQKLNVDDKTTIRFFDDKNNDKVKQEDEEYLTTDKVDYDVSKVSERQSYQFNQGWNLVHFPFLIENIETADDLIEKLAKYGVQIRHVAKYEGGNFTIYTKRSGNNAFADDFQILPGQGYFVYSTTQIVFTIDTNKITDTVPIKLMLGWNLVGTNAVNYTGQSLIEKINSTGLKADTISRYDAGLYKSLVLDQSVVYGNDFNILQKEGYFIRVTDAKNKENMLDL